MSEGAHHIFSIQVYCIWVKADANGEVNEGPGSGETNNWSRSPEFRIGDPKSRITVVANPEEGGSVAGGGLFVVGSQTVISATANTNWTFTGWNGGSTANPRTITVPEGGAAYTARFQVDPTKAEIQVSANPAESGEATGGGFFTIGQTVEIGVTENPGWVFVRWNDGNTENPRTITVPEGGGAHIGILTEETTANPLSPAVFHLLLDDE